MNRTANPVSLDWKGAGDGSFTNYRDIGGYDWTYLFDVRAGDVVKLGGSTGPYEYTAGNSNACVIIEDSGVTVR